MTDITADSPPAGAPPKPAQFGQPGYTPKPVTAAGLLGFFAMVFGMFMAILDIQIVSSSISEIQAGLSASADEISWVQTSYLIAEVVMIPLSGYLSRVFSTRILFVISSLGFTLASAGCALSTSLDMMIVMRALQGFLGGAMIPTVFASIFLLFPRDKSTGPTVLIGLVATMAPTIGPTVGGYLTQLMSWHWLFLINLVPGIVVSMVVFLFVDIDHPDMSLLKGFDFTGLLSLAVFLGCLEYVIEEGPRHDWFAEEAIRNNAVACGIAAMVFFWRAFTHHNPIVDLRPFTNRSFVTGCLYSLTLGVGLYGMVYLLPLYLARVRGLNSLQIGEIMFVTGACQFLAAPFSNILSRKFDARVVLAIGMLLLVASTWQFGHLTGDWLFEEMLIPQMLRGTGLMFAFIPVNQIALSSLAPHLIKSGSGLFNLTRNLGGAFGLAAINTMLNDRGALHWNRLIDNINPGRPEVQNFIDSLSARFGDLSAGDSTAMATKLLGNMVTKQTMVLSFADCFVAMAALFAIAAVSVLFVKKPNLMGSNAGGGH